ncbi:MULTISPECIES: sensor histidine kinase [Paraliobacillus]|uniref:sensor histidine kinase n=1 Tax=Paraliobacillus TaxID=200903 RepID=UPI000E3E0AF4|nr:MULTISPECIES: sensor histidine kinase [Paraliobacillus]
MRQFKWIKLIEKNNLFIKIFFVTVISITLVSLLITVSSIRMSTELFLETFSITNSKINTQIRSQFEAYSNAVVKTSNQIESNGTIKRVLSEEEFDSLNLAGSYYEIINQLESIYSNLQPLGANMIVTSTDQQLYNMNYSYWPTSLPILKKHPITQITLATPDRINYHFVKPETLNGEAMLVSTKALSELSSDHIYGILYISISEKQLRSFYEGYTSAGNDVLLIDRSGKVISSNNEANIGLDNVELLEYAQKGDDEDIEIQDITLGSSDYLFLSEYIPGFDMYLVNLIDKQKVTSSLINTREIILISSSIVFFAVIGVFIVSRRITKSLSRLVTQIAKQTKHDFSKRIEETGGYEAEKIARAFNYTLDELQDYVKIVVESQKNQRDAELRALQHQINPHFLYNTLTTVKFMVMQEKTEQAMETIHALISLLQSALGEVSQTVSVEQELENMKYYVFINQARYGERIKVNYFIVPDVLHYHIPKLVLQPFIENAFFHGFNKKKEGYIQIMIHQEADTLVCEVVDDGDGMQLEKEQFPYVYKGKRQMFSGIGMRNVHERILLLYGDRYGVQVSSTIGEGTKVVVRLPLITNSLDDES